MKSHNFWHTAVILLILAFVVPAQESTILSLGPGIDREKRGILKVQKPGNWTQTFVNRTNGGVVLKSVRIRKFNPSPVFNVTNSSMSSNYGPVLPEQVQVHQRQEIPQQLTAYSEPDSRPGPLSPFYSSPRPLPRPGPTHTEPPAFMQPPHADHHSGYHQYGPPMISHPVQVYRPTYTPHRPHKQKQRKKKRKKPFRVLTTTIIGTELLLLGSVVVVAGMLGVTALIGLAELATNVRYMRVVLPLLLFPVGFIPFLLLVPAFFIGMIVIDLFGLEEGENREQKSKKRRRMDVDDEWENPHLQNPLVLRQLQFQRVLENIEQGGFMDTIDDS